MPDPEALALREQFGTVEQQRETATFGMWVFLATEVLFFGGLFTAFAVYYTHYAGAFTTGSGEMSLLLGAINTAVLISSSLTMALSIHSMALGNRTGTFLLLIATILLGAAFLGIKFTEYYQHYLDHRAPGVDYVLSGPDANHVELFFVFYFCMTGLHALHMIIGIGLLSVLVLRTMAGSFTAEYYTPVETVGLYWHFVDLVWLFLYAIFYLPGAYLSRGNG